MIEIKNTCYKGTRILLGNYKRELINDMIRLLRSHKFDEIQIPVIQFQETFAGKVGDNGHMMFNFKDRGDRDVCLAPEYTAVIQQLAKGFGKDKKLFYVQECFRGENPQSGRWRQFTQLGVEILNPTRDYIDDLLKLARQLMFFHAGGCTPDFYKNVYCTNRVESLNVTRGLDYYKEGKGFEIAYMELGAQKQIVGGGEYEGGVGFALGVDRLMLIRTEKYQSHEVSNDAVTTVSHELNPGTLRPEL